MSASLTLHCLLLVLAPAAPQSKEDKVDAHGYDRVRIEQEDRLAVPPERVEEVWEYLRTRLTEDKQFLAELDPAFTSKWSEELFHDTYFDTPSMQLYALQSGVRHRRRENLSNPDDPKSGRELMQIKFSDISANDLERGEIKFEIERLPRSATREDRHPMLGRVREEQREAFKQRLVELGLDPQAMRPILTVRDVRRRVYLLKDEKPFMSISHDQASADLWWAHAEFCEVEPELNEIGFTEADPATRRYMESVRERVVQDLKAKFPDLQRDLTPKYNRAFDGLEKEISFLRKVVYFGVQDEGGPILVFGGVVLLIVGVTVPRVLRRKRADRAYAAQREARRVQATPTPSS